MGWLNRSCVCLVRSNYCDEPDRSRQLSGTLAEVDVGAAPQPRYQVSQAQAALTDDDLRAILVTSGMPYLFKNLCASFKPPLKLLPENIHKYVLAKLSDDPEAIDRIKRLRTRANPIRLQKIGARLFLKSIRTIGTQLREYVTK